MTYRQFDVVVVPFPFTDINASKRRPALVLSAEETFDTPVGHSVMAMKLFTLDHTLVHKPIGRLGEADQSAVTAALTDLLAAT